MACMAAPKIQTSVSYCLLGLSLQLAVPTEASKWLTEQTENCHEGSAKPPAQAWGPQASANTVSGIAANMLPLEASNSRSQTRMVCIKYAPQVPA